MGEMVKREYEASLSDLTFNSKPLISKLTEMAKENVKYAPQIVEVIEARLQKAKPTEKLPVLYLMDSVIKNMKSSYLEAFTPNIVQTFCGVFEKIEESDEEDFHPELCIKRVATRKDQFSLDTWSLDAIVGPNAAQRNVDKKTRESLFEMRMTWSSFFPSERLYAMDLKVKEMDPEWPALELKQKNEQLLLQQHALQHQAVAAATWPAVMPVQPPMWPGAPPGMPGHGPPKVPQGFMMPPFNPALPMPSTSAPPQLVPPVQQGTMPVSRNPSLACDKRFHGIADQPAPAAMPPTPVVVAVVPPVQNKVKEITRTVTTLHNAVPSNAQPASVTSNRQLKSTVTIAPLQLVKSSPRSPKKANDNAKDKKPTVSKQQGGLKVEAKPDEKKDSKPDAKQQDTKVNVEPKPKSEGAAKLDKPKEAKSSERSPRRSSDEKHETRGDSKSRDKPSREPERRTSRDSKKDFDKRDSWSSRERDSRERADELGRHVARPAEETKDGKKSEAPKKDNDEINKTRRTSKENLLESKEEGIKSNKGKSEKRRSPSKTLDKDADKQSETKEEAPSKRPRLEEDKSDAKSFKEDRPPRGDLQRGQPMRSRPFRDHQPRGGPPRGEGVFRDSPPREGLPREEFNRDHRPREGPLRNSLPREDTFRDGPPRDAPFREGPREDVFRDGPQRKRPFRYVPPRNAPFREDPRDREGHFRDGLTGHPREGPMRAGPGSEGPFRDGPNRDGPHREGRFKEDPHWDGPHHEDHFREGPPRERGFRDGSPPRDVPFGEGVPRNGHFRERLSPDGYLRGQFRDGLPREGPPREGPVREGPFREGPPREGSFRRSPPRDEQFREGDPRHLPRGNPRRHPQEHWDPRQGPPPDLREDRFHGPQNEQRMRSLIDEVPGQYILPKDMFVTGQRVPQRVEDCHDWSNKTLPCKRCKTCWHINPTPLVYGPKKMFKICGNFSCKSTCVIYCIICKRCDKLYIGETGQRLAKRFGEHVGRVKDPKRQLTVHKHFATRSHSIDDMSVCVLDAETDRLKRRSKESDIISKLGTLVPNGLNMRLDMSYSPDDEGPI